MSRVAAVGAEVVRISDRTCWTFLRLRDDDGVEGLGEASLFGREDLVMAALRSRAATLIGWPVARERERPSPSAPLHEAAADSAIAQALWDIAARRRGVPVAEALGGAKRERIPLYANINRRTRDRTPEGFAKSARDAKAAGHVAFKLAPFDAVTPDLCRAGEAAAGIAHGLACAAAVGDAVGAGHDVMIDCHWRFDETRAADVIAEAASLGLVWIECPLPEAPDAIPAIKRLRGLANMRGMRLAGCEELVGLDSFMPFIAAGAYDVLMPDVKYCGGPTEMLRLAQAMTKHGVAFSPHNPSGPICHAASLHVSAATENLDRLETQFDEGPLFSGLVREAIPPCVGGCSALPAGPGVGLTLDPAVAAKARVTRWSSDDAEARA